MASPEPQVLLAQKEFHETLAQIDAQIARLRGLARVAYPVGAEARSGQMRGKVRAEPEIKFTCFVRLGDGDRHGGWCQYVNASSLAILDEAESES